MHYCFHRVHVSMKINFVNIMITFLLLSWENQTGLVRTAMMLHGFWPLLSTIPSLVWCYMRLFKVQYTTYILHCTMYCYYTSHLSICIVAVAAVVNVIICISRHACGHERLGTILQFSDLKENSPLNSRAAAEAGVNGEFKLEDFTYTTSTILETLSGHLSRTNFSGITVRRLILL